MAFAKAGRYDEVLLRHVGANEVRAITTAEVTVFESDGTTEASLYTDSDKGTSAANPTSPTANGNLEFYADPGEYIISVVIDGEIVFTDPVFVHPDPSEDFLTLADGNAAYEYRVTIDPRDYGADVDGTDDTTAWNSAIAAINAAGDNADGGGSLGFTLRCPPGNNYLPSALDPIEVDGVHIEGSPNHSVITGDAGSLFTWGDGTTLVKGGGCRGVKFRFPSAPAASSILFTADKASQLTFDELKFDNVGQVLRAGESAAAFANAIRFTNIFGTVNDSGRTAFDLRHGTGFYISDMSLSVDGVGIPANTVDAHPVTADTNFIELVTGSWDTVMLSNIITNRFYRGINIEAATGYTVANVYLSQVILDYCAENAIRVVGTGGNVTKFNMRGGYIVATDGHVVHVDTTGGLCRFFDFVGVDNLLAGKNNWRFEGGARRISLVKCNSIGANRLAASNTGDTQDALVMSAADFEIIGGTHGIDAQPFAGYTNQARYALTIPAGIDNYVVRDAHLEGATAVTNIPTPIVASFNRQVSGNRTTGAGKINYAKTVAYSVPASNTSDTNKGPFTWDMHVYGGTVTAVKLNGVTVADAVPARVTVRPGDLWSVTYSVAPTVVQHIAS